MSFPNLTIVYNGGVYNFNEIRKELEKYIFDSTSDTEVVLKAFHAYINAVQKFIGMFAFVIWDSLHRKMYLFETAVKPLILWQN